VLPLLYLHGLSSSDFVPALEELFGSRAGLSASVVTRLTTQWQAEREAFAQRDLSEVDYVYCWADGVHFSIRLGEQSRLCCLVIVGVRADGRKELVAVADGTRESTEDWAELLRDLRRRGMGAPVVMVGDGRWGCGGRCGRSSPPPASSAAGSTWSGMSWVRCPEACRPAPGGR
jgi:putative transposase